MKQFLLFAGDNFYPAGGWKDFVASYDSAGAAFKKGESKKAKRDADWFHVIDSETGRQVYPTEMPV